MNISHEQAHELMQKSLQGWLDEIERAALAAHLAGCPKCSVYQVEAEAADRRLAQALPERYPARRYTPAELRNRLASMNTRVRRQTMCKTASSFARLAGAAVVIIAIIIGVSLLTREVAQRPRVTSGGPALDQPAVTPTECVNSSYIVQEGDTLSRISEKFGVTPLEIQTENQMDHDGIQVGQVLQIPTCKRGAHLPAEQKRVDLYYFYSEACPHCTPAKQFLNNLSRRYPTLFVTEFEVHDNSENIALFEQMAEAHQKDEIGVPAFFLGDRSWIGFVETTTPDEIEEAVVTCLKFGCPDAREVKSPGRIDLTEAGRLVREWIFTDNPQMNPEAGFPLEEITTDEIWNATKAQVFKITHGVMMYETFLIRAGQVHKLGIAFGDKGVYRMAVTDLDRDGSWELLYLYSFGSGIHQSSMGIAIPQEDQTLVLEAQGFSYQGDLELDIRDDSTIWLQGILNGRKNPETLGVLILNDGALILSPDPVSMTTFTDERFGVSLQYPANWTIAQEGAPTVTYFSREGFFELSVVGRGDSWSDLTRSCEWEVNNNPTSYGDTPQILLSTLDGRSVCVILTSLSSQEANSAVLFQNGAIEIARLSIDPAHLQTISATLKFTQPLPEEPYRVINMTPQPAPDRLDADSRDLGDLRLTEYAVVPIHEDTPSHFEYFSRIPQEISDRRAVSLDSAKEGLETANEQLAPFGYRLEARQNGQGEARYDLYHGEEMVKEDLTLFYPVSTYRDEQGSGDFAMLVDDEKYQKWLVRKDSLEAWDESLHRFTRPVFVGSGLATVERDMSDPSGANNRLLVKLDGQTVFTYILSPFMASETIKTLGEWNGQWVLEVNGTLIVGGSNWNQKEIHADEIFNWRMLNGKPFFFFRREGKVGAWYDGQELSAQWDEVIHDRCCEPGAFNVSNSHGGLWFHARKEEMWYYVELAAGE